MSKSYRHPTVPGEYSTAVVYLRNDGTTFVDWVKRGLNPHRVTLQARIRGYKINSVIRFKVWK